MSTNEFKLDDIRQELERKYAPLKLEVEGEVYVLQSLMRIDKERRKAVVEHFKVLDTNDEDTETEEKKTEVDLAALDVDEDVILEAVKGILSNVVRGPEGRGRQFVDLLGDDLMLHMDILAKWTKATQPGEADSSQN